MNLGPKKLLAGASLVFGIVATLALLLAGYLRVGEALILIVAGLVLAAFTVNHVMLSRRIARLERQVQRTRRDVKNIRTAVRGSHDRSTELAEAVADLSARVDESMSILAGRTARLLAKLGEAERSDVSGVQRSPTRTSASDTSVLERAQLEGRGQMVDGSLAAHGGHADIDEAIERLSELERRHPNTLFARGFLLCQQRPEYVPARWRSESLGRWTFYSEPGTPLAVHRQDGHLVLAYGDMFDVRDPSLDFHANCRRLADKLAVSEPSFYAETDYLHGRFLLLHVRIDDGRPQVMTDATGMRAVFHEALGGVVGSHAELVAANSGGRWRDLVRGRFGYPGRQTPYTGVAQLPPNQVLDAEEGRLHRFYPRERLEPIETEDAARLAAPILRSTARALALRYPKLLASLTAGMDSRVTLAALREFSADVHFFTYYRNDTVDTDRADRIVARQLARALSLDHEVLELDPYTLEQGSDMAELLSTHTHYRHIPRAANAYVDRFAGSYEAHVRSNLSEIVRSFYLKVKKLGPVQAPADLAHAYASFSARSGTLKPEMVEQSFRDFWQVTSFADALQYRDGRDLLYWEHRMGIWHSAVVLESDPAFTSFSLFNSRVLLDTLLAVPETDRVNGVALRRVIEITWPECLRLPFNPKGEQLESLSVASTA